MKQLHGWAITRQLKKHWPTLMKSADPTTPITIRGVGRGLEIVPSNCGSVIRGLVVCAHHSLHVGPRRSPTQVRCATSSLTPLILHLLCLALLDCQCPKMSMEFNSSVLMGLTQAPCCLIFRDPSIDTLNISKCTARVRFITKAGKPPATLFRHCSTSVPTSLAVTRTKPTYGNYLISRMTFLNQLTCQPNTQSEYANLSRCGLNKQPQITCFPYLIRPRVIQGTLANTHCLIPRHINQAITPLPLVEFHQCLVASRCRPSLTAPPPKTESLLHSVITKVAGPYDLITELPTLMSCTDTNAPISLAPTKSLQAKCN